jgi:hypothetical protein
MSQKAVTDFLTISRHSTQNIAQSDEMHFALAMQK